MITNAEKFEEVFGFKPDTEFGIINCPQDHAGSQCPYYEELDGGCHCETWWNEEYRDTKEFNPWEYGGKHCMK